MKDQMTKSDSLAVISEMIQAAKSEFTGNHFLLIFWGWLAIAIHLIHYCLLSYADVSHPELVWALSILGGIFTGIYSSRIAKKQRAVSHFERTIGFTWMAYGITILIIIGAGSKINQAIYPMITLLTAFPTFITGIIIKYKPLIFGASLFWIFAVISFMVSPINQILVGAIAIVCGYLVPGYMMKNSK